MPTSSAGGFGVMFTFFLIIMALVLGGLLGKFIYDYYLEKKSKDLQSKIDQTQEKANQILDKAREKSELESSKMISKTQEEAANILEKINNQKDEIYKKENELNKVLEDEKTKLNEIAKLTEEQAKEKIFKYIENKYEKDFLSYIEKIKQETLENAKQEANSIIAKTIYRVAVENSNNFVCETIHLPSEDYKGKIIGREGRNIQFFEKISGVEISMDDTPELIKISCFDPQKKFIAKNTLEKLIKDGRINPIYIEKYYKETEKELDEILKNYGKETLIELGIPMLNKEILEYIGKYNLRSSYGQNLLSHCKEVAKISELLANELGYDGLIAKKAGLLHDIGKIDVSTGESHAKIGADILRQYKLNNIIINSAESHHFEVKQTHPIAWIVTAADAISAGREGVRYNTKEKYIERIKSLENLILNIEGVKKTYIMQAGREIWAFINEDKISDLEINKINKIIKEKIEQNLDYPGIIKIISIRENKAIDYVG